MMKKAQEKGVKLLLPEDTICAKEFSADASPSWWTAWNIPEELAWAWTSAQATRCYA